MYITTQSHLLRATWRLCDSPDNLASSCVNIESIGIEKLEVGGNAKIIDGYFGGPVKIGGTRCLIEY